MSLPTDPASVRHIQYTRYCQVCARSTSWVVAIRRFTTFCSYNCSCGKCGYLAGMLTVHAS